MKDNFDYDFDPIISFEEYCVEVLDIPYYNFLGKEEWEICYEKYEKYLERNVREDNDD